MKRKDEANFQPIRSTTQICVVTRHQYGISTLVSQTSFGGESSGGEAKCWLFSQADTAKIPKISPGAYIFQRPFLRGLYAEGLIYGGKFAFQTR